MSDKGTDTVDILEYEKKTRGQVKGTLEDYFIWKIKSNINIRNKPKSQYNELKRSE